MARSTPARSTTDTLTRYPSFLQASNAACKALVAIDNGSSDSLGKSSADPRVGIERTAATDNAPMQMRMRPYGLRQIMRASPPVMGDRTCSETTKRKKRCQGEGNVWVRNRRNRSPEQF